MIQRKVAPILVTGLLIAGLAMMALGWNWDWLVPSAAYWGQEQAEELINAQADLHAKMHHHGTEEEREQEFATARDRLVAIQQQLNSARSLRDRTGSYVAWIGIVLILAGVGLHFTTKQSS